MIRKLYTTILTLFVFLIFTGCSSEYRSDNQVNDEILNAYIIGSAENPDPILEKVIELQEKGILTDVVIMESYPVQIRLTGPKNIIEKLQSMPRKVSENFR